MNISVIVCTHNRSESLGKTLASIAASEVPGSIEWELLVVDNNSTDATRRVAEDFGRNSGLNARVLFEPRPGLSFARNLGVSASLGEILAFTDDDVHVSNRWIAEIQHGFDAHQPACMGGRILRDPTLPLPDWWDYGWRSVLCHFDRGNDVAVAGSDDRTEYAWGANISFHRSVFEKYGLFRTHLGRTPDTLGLGEDSELVLRLRHNGERVIYYPQAVVVHSPSTDRLSKDYLRRWTHCLGVSTCLIDREFPKHWPRLLRVPRWRYRWAFNTLWQAARLGIRGDERARFQQELNLIMLGAYAKTALRGKNSASPTPRLGGRAELSRNSDAVKI